MPWETENSVWLLFLIPFPPDSKIYAYRHTASIAAGNHGIPVVVAGHNFGNASGMAPRAQYDHRLCFWKIYFILSA